jgi:hypothetical protein
VTIRNILVEPQINAGFNFLTGVLEGGNAVLRDTLIGAAVPVDGLVESVRRWGAHRLIARLFVRI